MKRMISAVNGLLLLVGLTGCTTEVSPPEPRDASSIEVSDDSGDAFSLPMPILSEAHRRAFFVGNSLFNQNWVSAPSSVDARDGLGPLFNARSCSTCHFKDGRGRPPENDEPLRSMLLRISIPGPEHQAPVGDPIYGDQIQGEAIAGVSGEASVKIQYEDRTIRFPDGEQVTLRAPRYQLTNAAYGPLSEHLLISARVAPHMVGLGLLEAVEEQLIAQSSDPSDANRDGISGRMNRVLSAVHKRTALGRFGWKAEQPSVREQTAGAFLGDMGITSTLHPKENHTVQETDCHARPSGGTPELSDTALDAVALYARTLAVPARRRVADPRVKRGEALFRDVGCASCHLPTLRTSEHAELEELRDLTFHPYTDLLLHDMGEDLSDERPTFEAEGREFRTAPLWGVGLIERVNGHTRFLHDGRARNLTEAILWHGGEAERSRDAFAHLIKEDRAALVAFLESL